MRNAVEKIRVLIPTTNGLVEVLLLTQEDPAIGRCVACIGGTTDIADIAAAYHDFVVRPTGVVERLFGHSCFRLDVSDRIDAGSSWQLGVLTAHACLADGRLAQENDTASHTIWATGSVRAVDLTVRGVTHIAEKFELSIDRLRREASEGRRVLVLLPQENLSDLPIDVRKDLDAAGIEVMALASVQPLWNRLAVDPSALRQMKVPRTFGAQGVVIENLSFSGSALPEQPPQDVDEDAILPCPYPGLSYFGPQDSALFFGRDAAITRLEAVVAKQALTALVGASGSGKSSVVLAGLAPRLNVQRGWRFTHFRVGTEPNKTPFLALARALVPLFGERRLIEQLEEVQKLAASLEKGTVDLVNVMGACRTANPGKRILLIADQFEEVFTLVRDEVLRNRFIDVLLAGFSDQPGNDPPDICLVLTLRADFYGMALRYRPLADALQGRVENLGPMTREELREAIVRSAGAVTFETGLVDTLLDDVGSRPGNLPLLQFALREMWGQLDKYSMTRATYEAIGGVEGALAKRAQAVYDALTMQGEDLRAVVLFRRLFTRLVTLGEGAEDTRRIVGRDELGQELWALAQRLAGEDNRLIVTSAPAPDHETAEVVHEALIRNWPTLVEWVNRDRDFQFWLRQLKAHVDAWRKYPEDDGTLIRGGPLAVAEEWLQRRGDEVSETERNYIDLCVKHVRLARSQARRVQALIYVLFVGIIASLLGVVFKADIDELWFEQTTVRRYIATNFKPYVLTLNAEQALKPGDSFSECVTYCPDMVVVPPGEFWMGSPEGEGLSSEYPRHKVKIDRPFAVGKFEVTWDEWEACVAMRSCDGRPTSDAGFGKERRPVINVSWDQAKVYADWLSRMTGKPYRLLTEAEWDYAARGVRSVDAPHPPYPWGNKASHEYANYGADECCQPKTEGHDEWLYTAPVGQFPPNSFGLHDMHGNVWEWVEDCWHPSYEENPPIDGSAWIEGGNCAERVVRGGSWGNVPEGIRSAYRNRDATDYRGLIVGFRVARTLAP